MWNNKGQSKKRLKVQNQGFRLDALSHLLMSQNYLLNFNFRYKNKGKL